jgi:hypothetical protein
VDLSWRFDAWFDALPKSPKDAGIVIGCVIRTGRGERATPERIELVEARGVTGDSWPWHPYSTPGNQVSLINIHVARAVVEGDESRLALTGDNLQVDLDLSEANLPAGTLLEIGTALLRISSTPHVPCKSFVARFGATNTKRVARATRIGRRGRGVLCEVLRSGSIQRGDAIAVRRP